MDLRSLMQSLGHGVFSVDSGYVRPCFDAVHLIVEGGRAAVLDTGTRDAVPRTLAALEALGVGPEAVDWVILTHVHLDHAGGAGELMRRLPAARLAVHPRGAPHMADPAKLWAGTVAVYGREQAEATYGEPVPVPASRIVPTPEGTVLHLAGRPLECLDAPGHARHHVVIRDAATGHVFAGDTFGISYRELDVDGRAFAFPSSTPVQFDPAALRATLRRILDLRPEAVYLTHWSRVEDVPRLGATLLRLVDAYEAMGLEARAACGDDRDALLARLEHDMDALLLGEAAAHGCRLVPDALRGMLAMDIRLNAAGIAAWLGTP
ncbi:MAG: MBL fold metallo-hydrolase [Burkholderiales bacterium]|jgi:glyoxylase-like metal-dependent hydrolase (beta-lactamase superfamily II)